MCIIHTPNCLICSRRLRSFYWKGVAPADAFNSEQWRAAGLQEMVTLFPGLLRPKSGGSGPEFIPLLRTGPSGGTIPWGDVVQQSFMGISGIKPAPLPHSHPHKLYGRRPLDRPDPCRQAGGRG